MAKPVVADTLVAVAADLARRTVFRFGHPMCGARHAELADANLVSQSALAVCVGAALTGHASSVVANMGVTAVVVVDVALGIGDAGTAVTVGLADEATAAVCGRAFLADLRAEVVFVLTGGVFFRDETDHARTMVLNALLVRGAGAASIGE